MISKVLSTSQTNNSMPAIGPAGLRNQSKISPAGEKFSFPLTPYLDLYANVSPQIQNTPDIYADLLTKKCPGYFKSGVDETGHRVAMELYCGKEWCHVCGKKDSPVHQRRFARLLPKALQIKSMGYLNFTIPEELRRNYRTRKELKELGHNIQEMMKAMGYSRGFRRWHFFGDKSTKYNPHLNVIIEADYLSPSELETIKKVYAVLLGVDMADVHYEYTSEPEKKVHILKYVTRATFLDYRWEPELAFELSNFRNQVSWGRGLWNQEPVWSLDDMTGESEKELAGLNVRAVEALESGYCHRCGLPITWATRAMPIYFLKNEPGRRSLGAGYWELADLPPPGIRAKYNRLESIAYWLKVCRRAGVKAVPVRSGPGQ